MSRSPACPVSRLLACLLLVTSACSLTAEDWPQFRGPTGQGISTEKKLPIQWGPDKNVKWKTAIPGLGWSSPVLVKGRIYLTTAVPQGEGDQPDQSLRALCLDAKTGDIVWDEQVFLQEGKTAPGIHGKNSHASPTPVVVGERLYVHFGHMGTACLDLSGKPVWTNRDLSYKPVHGNGGSPVYVDDLLIFTADGGSDPRVVALEASTGEVRWRYARPPLDGKQFSFATPLVIDVAGQKQIVAPGAGSVSGLNPADGAEIWRVRYGDGYSVIPRPVFAQGLLFLSSGYDDAVAFAINPAGRGDVTTTHFEWQTTKAAPHTPSMLALDEEVYMVADNGAAACYNARTGKQNWQQRLPGAYSASPVYADGKIYFVNEEGKGTVIAPGKKYKKLGDNGFPERTLASYAIGDGAIFVRTKEHLYRIHNSVASVGLHTH
jgi:outer membrane protein assembly factor BamB